MRTAEQNLDVAEIAKRVRSEIKSKVKTGELPRAKYSVTIQRYSGGRSLNVNISDVVFPVTDFSRPGRVQGSIMALGRIVEQRKDPNVFLPECHYPTHTPEGKAVLTTVQAIVDRYHWDESDISTDYFHCNFYRTVRFDWEYENAEEERVWCAFVDQQGGDSACVVLGEA